LVLVLLPRWVSSAVTEAFLDSLESRLSVAGLTMLVYYGGARGRLAGVWRAVTPRAVISAAPFTAAERRELRQTGVQALTMGESSAEGSSDEALQERIGRMQVDYLADAGHRRIAIATSSDKGLEEFAAPRLAGARQRCAELGLPAATVSSIKLDVEATRSVVATWRQLRPPITAVAAYNDEVALAVLGAAHSEGIRVPDDLAIIGVDDLHAGRLVVPALTTVVQAVELEARYLAARVLQDSVGPSLRRPSLDEYLSIVVRGSA
jgi:DNA-binding LacI/PurR family transcriptional regulator